MGYFDHPFVSNSDLSTLEKELNGDESPAPYEAYRQGSLVDGVITEQQLIDRIQMKILGTDYTFTRSELAMADKMNTAFHNHPLCSQIYKVCRRQVELYIPDVRFKYQGIEFFLGMRCKFDFHSETLFADLKSTSATTQAQFEEACKKFKYWRQVAHYGNLGRIRRAIIIGVSKINFKVFIVKLEFGDERWSDGVEQLNYLSFKYWVLKNINNEHIHRVILEEPARSGNAHNFSSSTGA